MFKYNFNLTVCLFPHFFTRKRFTKLAQCGKCRNTYNPLEINELPHLTFVYILKIAESRKVTDQDCMKATEMFTMSEVKAEKSIHCNQFDPAY